MGCTKSGVEEGIEQMCRMALLIRKLFKVEVFQVEINYCIVDKHARSETLNVSVGQKNGVFRTRRSIVEANGTKGRRNVFVKHEAGV